MVLIEINNYKTTEVKLNEEMILAINNAPNGLRGWSVNHMVQTVKRD